MRALVVDDDVTISSFVANGLREAGFAVDTVANGHDALAVARATPFDVAVVDVMLPGFDGLELIERMRTAGLRPVCIDVSFNTLEFAPRRLQSLCENITVWQSFGAVTGRWAGAAADDGAARL